MPWPLTDPTPRAAPTPLDPRGAAHGPATLSRIGDFAMTVTNRPNIHFMGTDARALASHLVSPCHSAAVLEPDAPGPGERRHHAPRKHTCPSWKRNHAEPSTGRDPGPQPRTVRTGPARPPRPGHGRTRPGVANPPPPYPVCPWRCVRLAWSVRRAGHSFPWLAGRPSHQ